MESLHYLLMKAHTMLQRRITAEAVKIGLSSGQPKVLDYLLQYEGSDQKTIAAYCEIEQATVGSILTRMESGGLVERRQREGNRRSLYVYLTDSGRRAAEDMRAVFAQADSQAAGGLSQQELAQLKYLLGKVCGELQKESEE